MRIVRDAGETILARRKQDGRRLTAQPADRHKCESRHRKTPFVTLLVRNEMRKPEEKWEIIG